MKNAGQSPTAGVVGGSMVLVEAGAVMVVGGWAIYGDRLTSVQGTTMAVWSEGAFPSRASPASAPPVG